MKKIINNLALVIAFGIGLAAVSTGWACQGQDFKRGNMNISFINNSKDTNFLIIGKGVDPYARHYDKGNTVILPGGNVGYNLAENMCFGDNYFEAYITDAAGKNIYFHATWSTYFRQNQTSEGSNYKESVTFPVSLAGYTVSHDYHGTDYEPGITFTINPPASK